MQSVKHSMIEVVISTAAAFLISLLVQQFIINPVWHLHKSPLENLSITVAFTVISLVRSYYFRRFFNWYHNRSMK